MDRASLGIVYTDVFVTLTHLSLPFLKISCVTPRFYVTRPLLDGPSFVLTTTPTISYPHLLIQLFAMHRI